MTEDAGGEGPREGMPGVSTGSRPGACSSQPPRARTQHSPACFPNGAPTARLASAGRRRLGRPAPLLGTLSSLGIRATRRAEDGRDPQRCKELAQDGLPCRPWATPNSSLRESFLKGPENLIFSHVPAPTPPILRQALSPKILTPIPPRMPSVLEQDCPVHALATSCPPSVPTPRVSPSPWQRP